MATDFKKFFGEHAHADGEGKWKVNLTDYRKLLAENGIPETVLEQIEEVQTGYNSGAAQFLVDKAKSDGITKEDTLRIVTSVPGGQDEIILKAYDQNPNPRDRSQIVETYGRISIRAKRHRFFDKAVLGQCSEEVKKICK